MDRHRRARICKRQGARLRTRGRRRRPRRDSRGCAVYSARGRTGLDLRTKRFAGRPVPDSLRTARVPRIERPVFARNRSRGELVYA